MIYVARHKHNNEIVAVFQADDEYQAFWEIDRVTDPMACEYAKVRRLFIGFPRQSAAITETEGFIDDIDMRGGDMTGAEITGPWKRFSEPVYRQRDSDERIAR